MIFIRKCSPISFSREWNIIADGDSKCIQHSAFPISMSREWAIKQKVVESKSREFCIHDAGQEKCPLNFICKHSFWGPVVWNLLKKTCAQASPTWSKFNFQWSRMYEFVNLMKKYSFQSKHVSSTGYMRYKKEHCGQR